MTIAAPPAQQYLLLENQTWSDYLDMERRTDDRPGLRLTYDRGRIEVMTLSYQHENLKEVLDRLLFALVDELDGDIASGGSTIFRKEILDRGLEPDVCYYLENAPLVRGKDKLDLDIDPPPDLAIEVEVSRSALDRIGIYAALGVPEVWRTDGESMTFLLLNDSGDYEEHSASGHFPAIRGDSLVPFLQERKELSEIALVREFRQWARDAIAKS